eukprot:TRINITY_DN8662_c0_g1_i1.p1 TRINITY_DN8662_c0_g1~~TRINITY_DN8662_c0_g1_i1.p1  ORF type:complete len:516 (-),score=118.67 TRINITY_DN8662_c0_g1_i1:128-1675(-)
MMDINPIYNEEIAGGGNLSRGSVSDKMASQPVLVVSKDQEWAYVHFAKAWSEIYHHRRLQFIGVAIILLVVSVSMVYVFWSDIQEFLGQQTATVTQLTLDDKEVKFKVEEFAKALVNELLEHYSRDEETHKCIVEFTSNVVMDPKTLESVVKLFRNVLVDPSFHEKTIHLAKVIVDDVLADQKTTDHVVTLLKRVSEMPETEKFLSTLFVNLFRSDYIKSELQILVVDVITQKYVTDRVNTLANNVSNNLLTNEELIQQAQNFVNQTLSDGSVQEAAGSAVWEALKIALTPSFFRAKQTPPVSPPVQPIQQAEPLIHVPTGVETEENLINVPDELLEPTAEILFRQAYERVVPTRRPALSLEELEERRRNLKADIQREKKNLSSKLRKKLQEVFDSEINSVFALDRAIVDAGGEDALIVKAKSMIEKQIAVYETYLNEMKKSKKGWIYNSYSPAQLEDREKIQSNINKLIQESNSHELCLQKSLNSLGYGTISPVHHLQDGTIEELLQNLIPKQS